MDNVHDKYLETNDVQPENLNRLRTKILIYYFEQNLQWSPFGVLPIRSRLYLIRLVKENLLLLLSGLIEKQAAAAGGAKCSRVDADAVRAATGYPIGGVPPFGHATQLRIFIDPDLLQYDGVNDMVWAAAGTWNDNFAIAPNELVRVSGGAVTDLKRG